MSFQQSKTDTLKRPDKSYIGGVDIKIKSLCDKINSLENYYTTSSCSGRVVIMIEKKQKDRELFLSVFHDEISSEELKEELLKIISSLTPTNLLRSKVAQNLLAQKSDSAKISSLINKKLVGKKFSKFNLSNYNDVKPNSFTNSSKINRGILTMSKFNKNSIIKFKLDPCILHVACKTLEDADKLLKKAQLAGWKKSGLLSLGKKIILELNSTERLEFPIIHSSKILVNDEFLDLVVEESNRKMVESWKKIEKLDKGLK